ncbi:nucleotidyltransferase domain-containing protein [Leptolyngbya sp. BC1307]|uniref:nucleotidyltransferase family protein n=1 Tax=Leptolyngbya sp. BC1307 TaxID=2029589 RepID=UPI000EFCC352|nr:nucleotidyltransferase domain-containing protein [Leptolyngbya sp. BC1307]
MTLNDLTPETKAAIKAICTQHGAFNVRIFGSVARGQADQNSDLDLLVDYDLDKISPWFPVRLIRDLENLLSVKVDIVTPKGLKARIRSEVLQEALTL